MQGFLREVDGLIVALGVLGAATGLGLYHTGTMMEQGGDARPGLALFVGLLSGPLLFALRAAPGQVIRPALVAGGTAAVLTILAWSGARHAEFNALGVTVAAAFLACVLIAGAVAVLEGARARTGRALDYPSLFDLALVTPIMLALAGAFALGVLAVAWLVAGLFSLIGLDALTDLLGEGWFALPLVGAAGLAGLGMVRRRLDLAGAAEELLLALARLVAPPVALAVAVFAVALLFRGLESLWEGFSPVAILTATAALGAGLTTMLVGTGPGPRGVARLAALLLCLTLPILMGLAAYGMHVRLGAQGLTPERLYAALIVGLGAGLSIAYALAAVLGGRWAVVRAANVGLLLTGAALAVFLLTPLFRPAAWSAEAQANRLLSGAVEPDAFDFAYLRFSLGPAGERALDRIAADPAYTARVEAVRGFETAWEAERAQFEAAPLSGDVVVRPEGATVPKGLRLRVNEMRRYRHPEATGPLVVILRSETEAWVVGAPYGDLVELTVWRPRTGSAAGEGWIGVVTLRHEADDVGAVMAAAKTDGYGLEAVTLRLPALGGYRFDPYEPDAMGAMGAAAAGAEAVAVSPPPQAAPSP